MLCSDTIQPSILSDNEENFVEEIRIADDNLEWTQNEQTEPLNLSINKPIDGSNDDAVIVEECKKSNIKMIKAPISPIRKRSRRVIIKDCPPRRNPIRRARNSKRFKDFTCSSSLSDDDFINDDFDNESEMVIDSDFKDKTTKFNHPIKKRRIIETVNMNELETLVFNNFIEMKNFVKNMKAARIIRGKFDENEWKEQCQEVINIVKYQGILLALVKGVENIEILKYWAN